MRLVRTLLVDADVSSLLVSELSEASTELLEVEASDLLIELLRKNVDLLGVLVGIALLPEFHLSDDLVGERAGHDERGVASSATKVEETTLSQDDDASAGLREGEAVDAGLDVDALNTRVSKETSHVDLIVEVTNVTEDSVVLHADHVVLHDDVLVTSSGDDNVSVLNDILEADDLVTFHACLEGADGVNLSDRNASTSSLHGLSTALTDITIAADNSELTSDHDISSTHDTIRKRVSATVDVVELGLGDRVVDVDSREEKLALLSHLVETVNTGGGLLRNTNNALGDASEERGVTLDGVRDGLHDDAELNLRSGDSLNIRELSSLSEDLLSLDTLVDQESDITTIIDDEVGALLSIGPDESLVGAPPVLIEGLTLLSEDSSGAASNNSSSGGVLSGEDVARAPSDLSTELSKRLNQDSSLDGHVERTGDASTSEGLVSAELLAASHETGHLNLSEIKLEAARCSQGHICNPVVLAGLVLEAIDRDGGCGSADRFSGHLDRLNQKQDRMSMSAIMVLYPAYHTRNPAQYA